jgi:O-antigen/teichoic acid export membrane protein
MGGVNETEPQGEVESRKLFEGEAKRFFFFSGFTYIFGLTSVFTDMGFAAPALALILTPEQVALFATAFKLSLMTVGLVVAGFRGVYRPLFARLRIHNEPEELRQAFTAVSKAQVVVLVPAGVGLMVMCGDFIPLLFGVEFLPSVPITWVLVAFMYSATAFNLPEIILSIDEQYRALGWARAVFLISVPLFVVVSASYGLVGAAAVLGGARLAPSFCCYLVSRRLYGLRFPWKFVGRIAIVSGLMGAVLIVARVEWMTSPFEAVTLTIVGILLYCIGLRATKALGADEVALLQRVDFPGHKLLVAWLAPNSMASRRLSR